MNNTKINVNDLLSFDDESSVKKGLRGHVEIIRENMKTGEKSLWYEDDNTIPISGYQWILMKMFGLYLDSSHNKPYENIGKDTTVVVPDLNNSGTLQLGVDPTNYSEMSSNISDKHFIQGFMIGNGGAGEDAITTKNTNYSFTKLRNPIPFQQSTSLSPSVAGQYLGALRQSSSIVSYYIKKFDETPHIYHSWWRDGQRWDYLDPVTQDDLGPDAVNGVGKTNRIETYCECKMSLDESDCVQYFNHDGSTQTAMVNELGLVAYDTIPGLRSTVEMLYNEKIKELIRIVYDNNRGEEATERLIKMAGDIFTVLEPLKEFNQPNISVFINTIEDISKATQLKYIQLQTAFSSDFNIGVEAFYNQNGSLIYTTDKFLEYMGDEAFKDLTTDEAQRIKLITYYTFNSIPLQSNWKIHVNYRIYAN